MTLACGNVGSEATVLSGGGRRAELFADSPNVLLDDERERMRNAPGAESRACTIATLTGLVPHIITKVMFINHVIYRILAQMASGNRMTANYSL